MHTVVQLGQQYYESYYFSNKKCHMHSCMHNMMLMHILAST